MYQNIRAYADHHHVALVAVSKTKPADLIRELYDQGQRIFGENRVQEMVEKYELLPTDIEWHLIGHLQKNKVKYIAPFVSLVHSVDSNDLLKVIHKEALKNKRVIPVLLQFHIADEETKFGLSIEEAESILTDMEQRPLSGIQIVGVMGMATFTDNTDQIREEFRRLKQYFDRLKARFFHESEVFKHISMGMSGDYKIAIEEGSTMIRVGSAIFGAR
ncbi:MAG: YggS family pyridoxal phosphate-dependent enzyme [Saprospiraceae bacterium]|nr:MAG: alanine racemase [Bacteroidetes bacterium OLB9]MCO6464591.1 YggS family pyridoxal phosphate-dependent enzyme [Saprospiraceae bacterium]MCZ2337375.1 YggS family pyridoxal phosphate-dependent enzyme [Chitinophagales bacterium]